MKAPDLGKMIGPLPLGGWLAAGGIGVAGAWYLRRKGGLSPAAAETAAAAQTAQVDASGMGGAIGLAGQGSSSNGATGGVAAAPAPQSNDEWGRQAVLTLMAKGFDALIATRAVADYLNGVQLDRNETAALTLILQLMGPPPQGTPPVHTTPPPTTTSPVLGVPRRQPSTGNTIVATAYRHDKRGGYAVTSAGGLIQVSGPNGKNPPAARWARPADNLFVGVTPVSIMLTTDDRAGVVTDSHGKPHYYTVPKAR